MSSFFLLDEVIERSIDNPEKLLVAVFCMAHTLLWVYVFLTDCFVQCMASSGYMSDGLPQVLLADEDHQTSSLFHDILELVKHNAHVLCIADNFNAYVHGVHLCITAGSRYIMYMCVYVYA